MSDEPNVWRTSDGRWHFASAYAGFLSKHTYATRDEAVVAWKAAKDATDSLAGKEWSAPRPLLESTPNE